ncbi:unnamed protein product [Peniophora sp. CBMAI 1063]|nr:unnamed protein product [Peniophora sp. CBMAI 1063]
MPNFDEGTSSDVRVTAARGTRLQISDSIKRESRGAVKTAIDILGIAASMTQNVPYLGVIANVLSEVLKIQNEVDAYRNDWEGVMGVARQIAAIINQVREQCESADITSENAFPQVLKEPFEDLERCIAKTITSMNRCIARPTTDGSTSVARKLSIRAREYLERGETGMEVKQCRADMQAALDLFNTKLQIDQSFRMHAMTAILNDLRRTHSHTEHPPPRDVQQPVEHTQPLVQTAPETSRVMHSSVSRALPRVMASLPAAPNIFHGRTNEINHIVGLLVLQAPARVAILGPGGIGKTALALTIMHHPEVEALFSSHRFFLSCEAAFTADAMVQEFMRAFDLSDTASDHRSPRDTIISHLYTLPYGIICVDNFETPWDADSVAVEALLAQFASLAHFALIITSRGAERPRNIAWSQPTLAPIKSLDHEAALVTWRSICPLHDEFSRRLMEAVDYVPLAVTLLAQLAVIESSEVLWSRWELEQTSLLQTARGPEHRLNNVESSIRLSLSTPLLHNKHEALLLLSLLSVLPQGLSESRIPSFAEASAQYFSNLRSSITLLKQCALAYSSDDGFLRILSPIRHYMLANHPIQSAHLSCLADVYCNVVDFYAEFSTRLAYAKKNLLPELANISAVFTHCLNRDIQPVHKILRAIMSFSRLCRVLRVYNVSLLAEAIRHAGNESQSLRASLLYQKGMCAYYQSLDDDSITALHQALALYQAENNEQGQARCLESLGDVYQTLRRFDAANNALSSAFDLYAKNGNRLGQANALATIGKVYTNLGEHDLAMQKLRSARDLYIELGDRLGTANTLKNIGALYKSLNHLGKAKHRLKSALSLFDEIGNRAGKAKVLELMGTLYRDLGEPGRAERRFRSALAVFREIESIQGEIDTLNSLGAFLEDIHRLTEARDLLQRARDLALDAPYPSGQARAIHYLGVVHVKCSELDEAETCFQQSLRLYEESQDHSSAESLRSVLGSLRQSRSGSTSPPQIT